MLTQVIYETRGVGDGIESGQALRNAVISKHCQRGDIVETILWKTGRHTGPDVCDKNLRSLVKAQARGGGSICGGGCREIGGGWK